MQKLHEDNKNQVNVAAGDLYFLIPHDIFRILYCEVDTYEKPY